MEEARRGLQLAELLLSITDRLEHVAPAPQQQPAMALAGAASPSSGGLSSPGSARTARNRRTTRSAAAAAAAAAATAAAAAPDESPLPSSAAAYVAAMKPLVLDTAPLAARHKFAAEAARDPMGLKARVQRVTSEMAGAQVPAAAHGHTCPPNTAQHRTAQDNTRLLAPDPAHPLLLHRG